MARGICPDPIKEAERKKKMSDALKGENHPLFGKPRSKETCQKISDKLTGRTMPEETCEKISSSMKGHVVTKKTRQRISKSNKGRIISKETRQRISVSLKGENHPLFGKTRSEETCQRISNGRKGKRPSKETLERMSEVQKGKHPSETTRKKLSIASAGENNPNYGKHPSEETRKKQIESHLGYTPKDETRGKQIEYQRGGFWYGAVTYFEGKPYCELWTKNLLIRIRAFHEGKSVLSGKTKADNNGKELSCHHVYHQKKACCIWDEDVHGYYAMIDGERYYIKGDPNKFVTLTNKEHALVSKDKLKWVKIFEDIIEKQGGKCYYTKEEWKIIKTHKTLLPIYTRYNLPEMDLA